MNKWLLRFEESVFVSEVLRMINLKVLDSPVCIDIGC